MQLDVVDGSFHPLVYILFDMAIGEGDDLLLKETVGVMAGCLFQPLIFLLLYLHIDIL